MIPVACACDGAATATSSQHVKHKYTNATRARTGDFAGRARAVNGKGKGKVKQGSVRVARAREDTVKDKATGSRGTRIYLRALAARRGARDRKHGGAASALANALQTRLNAPSEEQGGGGVKSLVKQADRR